MTEYNYLSIERVAKLIPFISLVFLVGAVMDEGLYYNSFGINIFSYTSLSEIINLFISSIPVLIFISIIAVFYAIMINTIFEKYFRKLAITNKLNRVERRKRIYKALLQTLIIFIIWTLVVFIIPTNNIKLAKSESYFIIKVLLHYLIILWFFASSIFADTRISEEKNIIARYIVLFLLIFFVSIYFKFRYKVFKIILTPASREQVFIQLKSGKSIVTNKDTMYLGKTKDYIFFYDCNLYSPHSFIYNTSEISEISISKHTSWFGLP